MAMSEGVNVVGCLAWSIYDNFEWSTGFGAKFGMQVSDGVPVFFQCVASSLTRFSSQYVNFTDPALPRYYKASFFEYARAFEIYQEK